MLSYRHAFHAGNHGDVLKHIILLQCLDHLAGKEKPFLYVDTHAGAGAYTLEQGYAAVNREWASGMARLPGRHAGESTLDAGGNPELPAALARYLKALQEYSEVEGSSWYPGSPVLASQCMRAGDRAVLCELHSSDYPLLQERFSADRRFKVLKTDGFTHLKAVLPPASRRGLVLLDPSYELASDYDSVPAALEDGLARFATGTFLIWYPVLQRPEAGRLPKEVEALAGQLGPEGFLRAELRIRSSKTGERGMSGSGMLVLNPPWTLEPALRGSLPVLAAAMGMDAGAGWTLSRGK